MLLSNFSDFKVPILGNDTPMISCYFPPNPHHQMVPPPKPPLSVFSPHPQCSVVSPYAIISDYLSAPSSPAVIHPQLLPLCTPIISCHPQLIPLRTPIISCHPHIPIICCYPLTPTSYCGCPPPHSHPLLGRNTGINWHVVLCA